MLLFSGSEILSGYVNNTVGIDIESNLDLRDSSRCRSDAVESELSEGLVVGRELSLALYDIDIYCSLVVGCGGEYLALLGRNCGVSLDKVSSYAAHGLDRKGKRCYIEKKDVTCARIACELTTLNGSTDSYALIRIKCLGRLFSGELANLVLYCGDSCGTTDKEYLSEIRIGKTCILHSVLYGDRCLFNKVSCEVIKLSSGKIHVEVLGAF